MLTPEQIQEIAKRHRIGSHPQERDYIQNIFLYLLYTKCEDFVFKGGTALKVIYKSPRYSEDLDFNSDLPIKPAEEILKSVASEMNLFGIETEIRDLKGKPHQGFGFRLSYKGPLYDGRPQTKSSVRVDVSLRGEKLSAERVLVHPEYPDLGDFTLVAASLSDIFAEKIRALLVRGKPRDLYDVWFLLASGLTFNEKLINEKLKLYNLKFDQKHFIQEVNKERKTWKQELESLLPRVPSFEEVREKVLERLKGDET
jgi:predicted nucleotidyltransferase component of viral defense system